MAPGRTSRRAATPPTARSTSTPRCCRRSTSPEGRSRASTARGRSAGVASFTTIDADSLLDPGEQIAARFKAAFETNPEAPTLHGEIALAPEADRADTKALILDGVKFNYYFASHTLTGKLTSLRLSMLGDSYDAGTESFDQAANGCIANVATAIEITGLSISGQKFHNLVAALMGGVDGGSTAANASPLRAAVAAQAQILRGSTGDDRYSGTKYADTAYGKSGNDILKGQAGNDKLVGGIGADSLHGGTGRDTFIYSLTADSTPTLADTIFDFRSGLDKINLSAIDANVLAAKNQAFAFVGTKAFSGAAGELRYQAVDGDVFVYGDTDGDKIADIAIHIDNVAALAKGDFIL